ncbi:MAG: glucosamine-6-phosphate deaminase [Lentisphaeria bacterium]
MEIIIQKEAQSASWLAAQYVAAKIRQKPDIVLGLATGNTPKRLYRALIRLHQEEGLDFSRVTTFNLDEYVGLEPDHPASYNRYMHDNFFRYINIEPSRINIPSGTAADIPAHCTRYEQRIKESGGIDVQILGIGGDGHIGFNEPSSSLASQTRIKTLTEETVADNSRFFPSPADVPKHVITMGIKTILESRACLMLAFGEKKAWALKQTVEGPVSASVPASALQWHPSVKVICDEAAASSLKRTDYYRWVYDNKPQWQNFVEN